MPLVTWYRFFNWPLISGGYGFALGGYGLARGSHGLARGAYGLVNRWLRLCLPVVTYLPLGGDA